MDRTNNPFAPGAGNQPPELAGREEVVTEARVALSRVIAGRPDRGHFLLGLRGVGKTVLLNKIDDIATELGYYTVTLEAPETRRLAEMLVPKLRSLLVKLSRRGQAKDVARRGLAVLRAFASAFKVSVGDVEFGVEAELGSADSGDLESDLSELLLAVASAAKAGESGVALLIDELQYLSQSELSALIVAVHKISQKSLPLMVFGAGLPQLASFAGEAKSYSERLFRYPDVGPLTEAAARSAIGAPLKRDGVDITPEALDYIIEKTKGYPYFLQEWGYNAWNEAPESPITREDIERATTAVLTNLDRDFFRVRFDRLTPREKDYMRAMAELGPGPHRSSDIARLLGMKVTAAGPLRGGLIRKGMIFAPEHGITAFTVPMFDAFMKRSMPAWTAVPAG